MHTILRLCLAVLIGSIAVAAVDECTNPGEDFYSQDQSIGCAPAQTCFTALCTCLSVTAPADATKAGEVCLHSAEGSCVLRGHCLGDLVSCLNDAADDNYESDSCSTWGGDLHSAIVQFGTSANYSASTLSSNCEYAMCKLQNETTNPDLCEVTEGQICSCASPDPFETTLTIKGNFTTSSTPKEALQTALEEDLYVVLTQYVCVYTLDKNDTHIVAVLRFPKGMDTAKIAVLLANPNWLMKLGTALGGTCTFDSVTASNVPWTTTAPPSSAARTIGLGAVVAMAALSLLV
jgi:hypothetical protein